MTAQNRDLSGFSRRYKTLPGTDASCLYRFNLHTDNYVLCTFRQNGLRGLYKGLETKMTQTVLMAALMFLTYEKIASVVFRIMRAQLPVKKAAA